MNLRILCNNIYKGVILILMCGIRQELLAKANE